jgi:hypothetical protein
MFESLGLDYEKVCDGLRTVYLVSQEDADQIVSLMANNQYKEIKNSQQLDFLFNWLVQYNIKYFGSEKDEKELLRIKKEVFKMLEKKYEVRDFDKSLVWKDINASFEKSIVGTIFYYGIDRPENKELGEKYLKEAAEQGDIDALLWCIDVLPDKRKYMQKLMSLSEFMEEHEWLESIKTKYGMHDVQEVQIKRKIGF